jgi:iron complex outermembrane receptor protein
MCISIRKSWIYPYACAAASTLLTGFGATSVEAQTPAQATTAGGTTQSNEAHAASEGPEQQTGHSGGSGSESENQPVLSEVVVTGTNIKGIKPVGSVPTIITSDEIQKTGFSTPSDVLRTLPQVQSESTFQQGGTTQQLSNGSQGSAIDLRGLGPQATLVLIDGRRTIAVGGLQTFTEADQLPLGALSRIEVVTDGTSAVYGSDAVAGVVNFVIRKDFDGLEASTRVDNEDGGVEHEFDLTGGKTWNQLGSLGAGNLLISYSYEHRNPYWAGSNPYLRQDMTAFGGVDDRINGESASVGFAPNIVVKGVVPNPTLPRAGEYAYWGVPSGNGVGVSASDLRLNRPNLLDYSDYWDYVGKQNRQQVVAFFNQELGDRVEMYAEAYAYNRDTTSRYGISGQQLVTLSPVLMSAAGLPTATPNPYYISGIPGVLPGAPLNVQYNTLKDIGPQIFAASARTYSITLGGRVTLGRGWAGEAYYTYGRNTDCDYCDPGTNVNTVALQSQIDRGLINPLSSQPLSIAQIRTFVGSGELTSHSGIDDAVFKVNGPLFDLPGGSVKAAAGVEWDQVYTANQNTSNAGPSNATETFTTYATSRYGRDIRSAFGELYVPFIGASMNVPFVQSLSGSAAIRDDDYSDVGQSRSPKFGIEWAIDDHFMLSGSWGKSFRAPSVTDINPQSYSSATVTPLPNTDPRITNGFLDIPALGLTYANAAAVFGSNSNLKPEKSTNWSVTASLKDGGFSGNVSFWEVDYRDRIAFPAVFGNFINPLTPPPGYGGYGSLVTPIHNPPTCTNSNINSADPALQQFLRTNILYTAGATVSAGSNLNNNFCSVDVVLDSRFINLSSQTVQGIDFDSHYVRQLGAITLMPAGSASVILEDNTRFAPGGPAQNLAGHSQGMLRWRARGSVSAAWRDISATGFLNFVGPYINDTPVNSQGLSIAPTRIRSLTTADLNLTYGHDPEGRATRIFQGWRASFTITNVFDVQPPLGATSGAIINESWSNPFGRTFSAKLTADLL